MLKEFKNFLFRGNLVEVAVACEHEFAVLFEGETDLTREALATVRSLADLIAGKRPR